MPEEELDVLSAISRIDRRLSTRYCISISEMGRSSRGAAGKVPTFAPQEAISE